MHAGRGKQGRRCGGVYKVNHSQTGQGNWKLKSLNLGKDSLGDPCQKLEGGERKWKKRKDLECGFPVELQSPQHSHPFHLLIVWSWARF